MSSGSSSWDFIFSNPDEAGTEEDSLMSRESKTKDAAIFLLDCSLEMFVKEESGKVPFQEVVSLIVGALKQKIISNPNDLVGVCFYGAKNSKNENGFDGIHIYVPLETPAARTIKHIEALLDPATWGKIGSIPASSTELDKAFWVCSNMFADSGVKNSFKRILVLTNNDSPVPKGDDIQRSRVIQKCRDLEDLQIEMSLIPLGKTFNVAHIWMDLIQELAEEDPNQLQEKFQNQLEDLQAELRRKMNKKRALGSVNWQVGAGIDVGVKIYCMFREAKADAPIWLDARTNEPLTIMTQWICQDTGVILEDYQMQKFYPYGGEEVEFEADEVKEIKSVGDPGLVLVGFKPMKRVKLYHNIKNPYFIFPDEGSMKGSTVAFNALLLEMLASNTVAICRMVYRRGGIPRFVALIPQEEKVVDGFQEVPAGMNLVFLPYADDIRKYNWLPAPIAEPDLIDTAKTMVKALKAQYDPYNFINPCLQKHYKVLQAMALDEDPAELKDEDYIQPDPVGMAKHQAELDAFEEAVYGHVRSVDEIAQAAAGTKRKATSSASGQAKRVKREAATAEAGEFEWKTMAENGTLGKLTIPKLKIYCAANGLAKGGKKADIIHRIKNHLGVEE